MACLAGACRALPDPDVSSLPCLATPRPIVPSDTMPASTSHAGPYSRLALPGRTHASPCLTLPASPIRASTERAATCLPRLTATGPVLTSPCLACHGQPSTDMPNSASPASPVLAGTCRAYSSLPCRNTADATPPRLTKPALPSPAVPRLASARPACLARPDRARPDLTAPSPSTPALPWPPIQTP